MRPPGPLNYRATIERLSGAKDASYGTDLDKWVTVATVWVGFADVLLSRTESVVQNLVAAKNQTRVWMRYRSGIDSSMRIVIMRPERVVHQIVGGPAVLGDREYLDMMTERYSS